MQEKDFPLLSEMWGASERASAIVGAAFLEDRLTHCIASRLVDDTNCLKRLFKPAGPIGNFGVKADLGFLLGLYSEKTRDDIQRIAQVRNWFAHWAEPTTFGTREIRVECEKLGLMERFLEHVGVKIPQGNPGLEPEEWAKFQYLRFVDTMAMFLDLAIKEPARPRQHVQF
jgi:hypothetical protein